MNRPVGVIGVPTSAGAFAPGQEQAPQALREGGLLTSLRELGVEVHDHGDRPSWRWRPDRGNPRAQNVKAVVEIVRDTAERATRAGSGELTLVLWSTSMRMRISTSPTASAKAPWTGWAWPTCSASRSRAGARRRRSAHADAPADQVVLLGWDDAQATPFERAVLEERAIAVDRSSRTSPAPRSRPPAGHASFSRSAAIACSSTSTST